MISKKHKCIFIEIPKTGSTSIRSIIGFSKNHHLDFREIEQKISCSFPFEDIEGHIISKENYNKIIPNFIKKRIGKKVLNEYFKFGFVRNPWSRTVSLYNRREGIQMRDKMSFEEFAEWIQYSSDKNKHPSQKRSQLDWFKNDQGEIAVDFIGKFESLNEDWNHIAKKLGIRKTLPHKQKNNPRKHYTEFYNSKTKEIIQKKFAEDIEYFEYNFR